MRSFDNVHTELIYTFNLSITIKTSGLLLLECTKFQNGSTHTNVKMTMRPKVPRNRNSNKKIAYNK